MGRALAVIGVALAAAGVASADPALDRARAAFDASDYLTARTALAESLAAGDNGKDELVEIYRLSATISAGLGNGSDAVVAFERMLALAPDATLPVGTSPKIKRPFATAQAMFKTAQPLAVKVDTAGEPPSLTLHVVSDPLHMIASAQVIARVDGGRERVLDQPATGADVTFALPAGHRIDVRAVARDDHGNRLAEIGTPDVPLVIIGTAPPPAPVAVVTVRPLPTPPARPVYLQWWLWGGAALALAATGTGFAVGVVDARDQIERLADEGAPASSARTAQDRGNRDALISNVAFGAAGALAIGGAILYATRARGSEDARHAHLAPVAVEHGGAIAWQGGF